MRVDSPKLAMGILCHHTYSSSIAPEFLVLPNKGFEEWGAVFGHEVMAAALIDRLLHHCHIVNIRGNSYRMRKHQEMWPSVQASEA